jgi:hypothetical protein
VFPPPEVFGTSALHLNRLAPKASAMVTSAGTRRLRNGGYNEMDVNSMLKIASPFSHPIIKIKVQIIRMTMDSRLLNAANRICNGVDLVIESSVQCDQVLYPWRLP